MSRISAPTLYRNRLKPLCIEFRIRFWILYRITLLTNYTQFVYAVSVLEMIRPRPSYYIYFSSQFVIMLIEENRSLNLNIPFKNILSLLHFVLYFLHRYNSLKDIAALFCISCWIIITDSTIRVHRKSLWILYSLTCISAHQWSNVCYRCAVILEGLSL